MEFKTKKLRFHTCQLIQSAGCTNGGTWIMISDQPKRHKTYSCHFILESWQELNEKKAAVNYNGKITVIELIINGTQKNQSSVKLAENC